jgi:hypothetical protein
MPEPTSITTPEDMNPKVRLAKIAQAFYQTHNATGEYLLEFITASRVSDSDGDSVVDAYLNPKNGDSAEPLHLQVLGASIPSQANGKKFDISITPPDAGSDLPDIMIGEHVTAV